LTFEIEVPSQHCCRLTQEVYDENANDEPPEPLRIVAGEKFELGIGLKPPYGQTSAAYGNGVKGGG
jgi:hypothetical protein